jgi:hypothetical protein
MVHQHRTHYRVGRHAAFAKLRQVQAALHVYFILFQTVSARC